MHRIDVDGFEPSLAEVLALDRNSGSHDSVVFHLLTVPSHLAKHQPWRYNIILINNGIFVNAEVCIIKMNIRHPDIIMIMPGTEPIYLVRDLHLICIVIHNSIVDGYPDTHIRFNAFIYCELVRLIDNAGDGVRVLFRIQPSVQNHRCDTFLTDI